MQTLPPDSNLLLPFEEQFLKGEYKDYYKAKRNNFFASVQKFSGLWRAFSDLDEILTREFIAMNSPQDANQLTPALLLLNSHAQARIAVELAFSGCPNEGTSVMRNAIESAVFALKMMREPGAAIAWAEKDDGPQQLERFRTIFERNKKKNLFPPGYGLDGLQRSWEHYSEAGSHTTPSSVGMRFETVKTDAGEEWRINYSGVPEDKLVVSVISLIDAGGLIERAVYDVFRNRLQFILDLVKKREFFHRNWRKSAKSMLTKLGLAPRIQP